MAENVLATGRCEVDSRRSNESPVASCPLLRRLRDPLHAADGGTVSRIRIRHARFDERSSTMTRRMRTAASLAVGAILIGGHALPGSSAWGATSFPGRGEPAIAGPSAAAPL